MVLIIENKVDEQWIAKERTILPRAVFGEFSIIKYGVELVLPHSEVVPHFHSVERRLRETSQPLYENQLGHLRDRILYEAL